MKGYIVAATVALSLGGCASMRRHRDTNAPGIIDVEVPPQTMKPGAVEPPRDPGEHMVAFNPGFFGAAGYSDGGAVLGGLEVSLVRGDRPRSHFKDDFFAYPLEGYGASLGWDLLRYRDGDTQVGPVYIEAQRFRMFAGGSIGYAINPDGLEHGPQIGGWLGPWFARARYLFDGAGVELFGGVQVKVPTVWIWSR